jgi:N-acetylglucosamine-6-phosphate deacetylase
VGIFTYYASVFLLFSIKRDKGYRILGVVEAAYLIDDMDVEIICDGHHLPDGLIQMVYKFKYLIKQLYN